MVAPYRHIANLQDLTDEEAKEHFDIVKKGLGPECGQSRRGRYSGAPPYSHSPQVAGRHQFHAGVV